MNVTNLTIAVEGDILGRLTNGIDTQKADDFLDQLFQLAGKYGNIACTLHGESLVKLNTWDFLVQHMEITRAKTKVRMLCARLAVCCSEWSNRAVAPYGDVVEFTYPVTKQRFKVRFENTTAAQQFAVEIQSGNGAEPPRPL